jgi:transcriptional regulator with XRE-family HTH domain
MVKRPRTISDQLRAAIAAAAALGISRYRISQETGVEQSALSRFVHGKQGLDLSSIDRLAAFLELELVKTDATSKGR